jgi:hypothetical protein
VISYFPIYSSDPSTGDKYENYCRTKMMFHHPFTDVKDLADIVDDVILCGLSGGVRLHITTSMIPFSMPDYKEENQYEMAS